MERSSNADVRSAKQVKDALRREYLAYRDGLNQAERVEKSREIIKRLSETRAFKDAEICLLYLEFRSEVITSALAETLLAQKRKQVYCPRVEGDRIIFYEMTHMGQLVEGYYGIREPEANAERRFESGAYKNKNCLVIMPGTVFDRQKGRIGYGRGFYDRFLLACPGIPAAALAFDCQIAKKIPMEESDVRPDYIVTEKELYFGVADTNVEGESCYE